MKNLKLGNMKAAVLVNGECRELPIAIKSWKFLNEIDCDIYEIGRAHV